MSTLKSHIEKNELLALARDALAAMSSSTAVDTGALPAANDEDVTNDALLELDTEVTNTLRNREFTDDKIDELIAYIVDKFPEHAERPEQYSPRVAERLAQALFKITLPPSATAAGSPPAASGDGDSEGGDHRAALEVLNRVKRLLCRFVTGNAECEQQCLDAVSLFLRCTLIPTHLLSHRWRIT